MARGSINKAIIIGRLGSDPEVRYTPGGAAVANFSVATDRGWKDKDSNWQNETTWHRIVVWNRTADFVKEYVKKGNRVYVEGRIQNRSWEDQNGQKHYVTEIVAFDVQLLESAPQSMDAGAADMPPSQEEIPPDEDQTQDDVPF